MADETGIERFCLWIEFALKFPNKQRIATTEICRILDSGHLNAKTLKVALEIFNNLYPSAFIPLWREVFARGSVNEEQRTESYISPFLCKLLFETVTSTLVGCAEYCANVWLERLQDHKQNPHASVNREFPNPMDFLKTGNQTESHVSFAIFTALSLQSSMQRKALIWECCELLKCTPSRFHIRVILGLFVLLEFYKSQLRPDTENCSNELEVWTDAWLRLVASSLLGQFRLPQNTPEVPLKYNTSGPSVHHVLCSLMISTQSFGVLKSYPSVSKKVVKGMEQLVLFSSGITTTWLNVIKSYFEDS